MTAISLKLTQRWLGHVKLIQSTSSKTTRAEVTEGAWCIETKDFLKSLIFPPTGTASRTFETLSTLKTQSLQRKSERECHVKPNPLGRALSSSSQTKASSKRQWEWPSETVGSSALQSRRMISKAVRSHHVDSSSRTARLKNLTSSTRWSTPLALQLRLETLEWL